jgi:uncharacterized membrane protein (UPF0127 family)
MRFRVVNQTRGSILADQAHRASGFFQRLVGLMGQPALQGGHGLHLLPCNGIHTFFMRAHIDAVFLDNGGVVKKGYRALPPWRLTAVYADVRSVLELPAGTLDATGTQVGDSLSFERVE